MFTTYLGTSIEGIEHICGTLIVYGEVLRVGADFGRSCGGCSISGRDGGGGFFVGYGCQLAGVWVCTPWVK